MSVLIGRAAMLVARRPAVAIAGMLSSQGLHSSPTWRESTSATPQHEAFRTLHDREQVGEQLKAARVDEALKFLFPQRVAEGSLSSDLVHQYSMASGVRHTFAQATWELVMKNDKNPRYLREACVLFYWQPMQATISNSMVSDLNFHAEKVVNAIHSMHTVLEPESALRALFYVVSLIVNMSHCSTVLRTGIVAACCRSLVPLIEECGQPLGFWELNRLSMLIINGRLYSESLLSCYNRACYASARSNARYYNTEFAEKWFYPLVFMSYPVDPAAMAWYQQCSGCERLTGDALLRLCWSYAVSGVVPPAAAVHALREHCSKVVISPENTRLVRLLQPYLPPDSRRVDETVHSPAQRTQFFYYVRRMLPMARCRSVFRHEWIDVAAIYHERTGEFGAFPPLPDQALQITRAETESFNGRPVALLIAPAGHVMRGDHCVSGVVAYRRRQLLMAGWRVVVLDQRQLDALDAQAAALFAVDYFKIHGAG